MPSKRALSPYERLTTFVDADATIFLPALYPWPCSNPLGFKAYFQRTASDPLLLNVKLGLAAANTAFVCISPHFMSVDSSRQISLHRLSRPSARDWLKYKAKTISIINQRLHDGIEVCENVLHSIAGLSGIAVSAMPMSNSISSISIKATGGTRLRDSRNSLFCVLTYLLIASHRRLCGDENPHQSTDATD